VSECDREVSLMRSALTYWGPSASKKRILLYNLLGLCFITKFYVPSTVRMKMIVFFDLRKSNRLPKIFKFSLFYLCFIHNLIL